jgi:hypothetical protein
MDLDTEYELIGILIGAQVASTSDFCGHALVLVCVSKAVRCYACRSTYQWLFCQFTSDMRCGMVGGWEAHEVSSLSDTPYPGDKCEHTVRSSLVQIQSG